MENKYNQNTKVWLKKALKKEILQGFNYYLKLGLNQYNKTDYGFKK